MSDLSEVAERVVDDADTDAAVVITTDEGVSDIGGYISDDGDFEHPAEPSLWMLALHIAHVRDTARGAGGTATVNDVVMGALERLKSSYEEGTPDE